MSTLDQIAESALGLPPSDRTRLVARLLESLDGNTPDEDVEGAWEQEVGKRIRDLLAGKAKTVPARRAISEARSRLGNEP